MLSPCWREGARRWPHLECWSPYGRELDAFGVPTFLLRPALVGSVSGGVGGRRWSGVWIKASGGMCLAVARRKPYDSVLGLPFFGS